MAGKSSLEEMKLAILGIITGKSILYLQCHFGQDTISLSRIGAHVTGVDFSDQAINFANRIAIKTQSGVNFICYDIYDAQLSE